MEIVLEVEGLPVEARLLIADALHGRADGGFDLVERARRPPVVLEHALAADFAGQDDLVGGRHRLAGDARLRILGQEQVDDGVGDLVGNLVGMAFGHGLGREEIIAAHRFG